MCRVLVFSKDRPMQLHGYLESLSIFSDIPLDKISVLYCHKDNIAYDKVKKSFPQVNWIEEVSFENQVKEWINLNEDDLVMFGCDDVLFKSNFKVEEIATFLKENDDIFGFSIRLGKNILGFPSDAERRGKFYAWKWVAEVPDNFHYPWELDCTIYRTSDVKEILNKCPIKIKNPNYLEEFVELAPEKYIRKEKMACYNCLGKAIVITVNRVQDTHCNAYDDQLPTDPETLGYLYNEKDYRLDVKAISNLKNNIVHVDSKYFILYPRLGSKKRNNYCKKLKTLLKNLRFLSSIDFQDEYFERFLLKNDAEIKYTIDSFCCPNILDAEQSISKLKEFPKSFTRFGDGELTILTGKSIPFQKYDPKLQNYLDILIKNQRDDIYVGLPFFYYHPSADLVPQIKRFVSLKGREYRKIIDAFASKDKMYLDTAITQMYQTYSNYEFSSFFNEVINLFDNREVSLVIGEGLFSSYKYNIFCKAKDLEIIEAPKKDAFDEFEQIIEEIKKRPRNRLICIVLGPTAKALTYELTNIGYIVWDIGHLLKDYNYFMSGTPRNVETITKFYSPD